MFNFAVQLKKRDWKKFFENTEKSQKSSKYPCSIFEQRTINLETN